MRRVKSKSLLLLCILLSLGCCIFFMQRPSSRESTEGVGQSIEEGGYQLSLGEAVVGNRNLDQFAYTQHVTKEGNMTGELRGSYTNVFVDFRYLYGSTPIPVMILQSYPVDHAKVFRVGTSMLDAEKAAPYMIYQDETVLIYNWLPLLAPGVNVESVLRKTIEAFNRDLQNAENWPPDREIPQPLRYADYAYLTDMEAFIKIHSSDLIVVAP